MSDRSSPGNLSRRQAVTMIAVTAGGGAFMPASVFAQSGGKQGSTALLLPEASGVCAIMPETTAGPFYFDPELERSDIKEDRKGVPLSVKLQVVDAACRPLAGKRVDIWHCDATGHYSGYPGQGDGGNVDTSGRKFLRGVQRSDQDGIVAFSTIYPGWYRGRTTHIHFRVFVDGSSTLTGQMFFPDEVSERLFATVVPYNQRAGERDVLNGDDRIALRAGTPAEAAIRDGAPGYEALLIVGVAA